MPKKEQINTLTTIQRESPIAALKNRVKEARSKLPKGWRSILIRNHSKYDTMAGTSLLNNVLNGRSTDVTLTEILEQIANGTLK